jgi:hypothetical protein
MLEGIETKGFFITLFVVTLVVAGLYLCWMNPEPRIA